MLQKYHTLLQFYNATNVFNYFKKIIQIVLTYKNTYVYNMVMTKKQIKENKMTKEKAILYELNALVNECEQINVDEISEIYAIKTFKNGKLKFEHKDDKGTYFYARRVLNSYNNGYSLEIDFHYLVKFMTKKEKQSRNIDEVMKDIEDVKINLWKGDLNFEKNIETSI